MALFEQILTPEIIRNKLFSFHNSAHSLHQDTRSGWQHDALGKLYEALASIKDDIPEKLMGYIGRRLATPKLDPTISYTPDAPNQLCQEILKFAKQLSDYGKQNGYLDIDNEAAALSGLAAQTLYRLTLS